MTMVNRLRGVAYVPISRVMRSTPSSFRRYIAGRSLPGIEHTKKDRFQALGCLETTERSMRRFATETSKDHNEEVSMNANTEDEQVQASGFSSSQNVTRTNLVSNVASVFQDIAENIVFDRASHSKLSKKHLGPHAEQGIKEVITSLDCFSIAGGHENLSMISNSQELISALRSLSCVYYSGSAAGVGMDTVALENYIDSLHSLISELLRDSSRSQSRVTVGTQSIEIGSYGYEKFVSDLSSIFSLLVFAACELGLGHKISQVALSMRGANLSKDLLENTSGSLINAVAFSHVIYSDEVGQPDKEGLGFLKLALEAMSKKEITLSMRDLLYCKLWITCLGTGMEPFIDSLGGGARSFVENVVMLEHVGESGNTMDDNATQLYTHLRKENRAVELDCITLGPFVFPVISATKKEIYTADAPEAYFDGHKKTHKREYLNWRHRVAELSGWKVVDIQT